MGATGFSTAAPSGHIVLVNNSTTFLDIEIVARRTDASGEYAIWQILTGVDKQTTNGSTTLVGTPVINLIGSNVGNTWSVTVTADTSNGRPAIKVTGENNKTIRWAANVRITKVAN